MRISHKWICELARVSVDPETLGKLLTFSGLEVEGISRVGSGLDHVVVGEIRSKAGHPARADLSVVDLFAGERSFQVVCGAPNCPGPGGRVVVALPGARVKDLKVEPRKLAGVDSTGMICSEYELDIGPDADGVLILDEDNKAKAGTPAADALGLDDWILEIGVTPNRPDALSHLGIAREVALLTGTAFAPHRPEPAPEGGPPIEQLVSVALEDSGACPRYAAAAVMGVEVRQSPFPIRYRLHRLGVRPISNLVDMTNLMLLQFGQPLHAFDLDRLAGAKLLVRKAAKGERMTTLDGIERLLSEDDLLICDGARPVAIAGVMGGLETGVTGSTRNLLIECAYFEPAGIRRTSKRLRLSSESSYRFERGIDPNMGPEVLAAASGLTVRLAGGRKAPGIIDRYPAKIARKVVSLRPSRFEALIGFPVAPEAICRILEGLGASTTAAPDKIEASVPTSRPDLEREVDLIEEVARVEGLDKVPSSLPRIRCIAPNRPAFEAIRRAKELLAGLGLEEAINYSFVPDSLLASVGMYEKVVQIANPLNAERRAMRTTLLPGLIESLRRAHHRFLPGIKQFEVGRCFFDKGAELPEERVMAAAILSGPAGTWLGEKERLLDLYDAKGIAERFVWEYAGVSPSWKADDQIACLHPRRALGIFVGDQKIGFLGELHPKLLEGQKLPRGAVAFELALEALWTRQQPPRAEPLPEYPPMARDVALLVDEAQDAEPIGKAIFEACGPLARTVRLFDLYRGDGIPEGKKSLAFSVVYQSVERTLTDAEVDAAHQNAVSAVTKRFGAVQR